MRDHDPDEADRARAECADCGHIYPPDDEGSPCVRHCAECYPADGCGECNVQRRIAEPGLRVVPYGGGVQSTALLVLAAQRRIPSEMPSTPRKNSCRWLMRAVTTGGA